MRKISWSHGSLLTQVLCLFGFWRWRLLYKLAVQIIVWLYLHTELSLSHFFAEYIGRYSCFFRKIVPAICCFTATLSAYQGGYQYYRLCLISLSHFRSYVFYICLFLIWSFIATKLFHYGFFTCVLTRQQSLLCCFSLRRATHDISYSHHGFS